MDAILLALTLLLVIIALICVGILAYVFQDRFLRERQRAAELKLKHDHLQSDLQRARERGSDLERRLDAARLRAATLQAEFEQVLLVQRRRRWFKFLERKHFRSK